MQNFFYKYRFEFDGVIMKKLNLSAKTITGLAVLTALVIVLQTFGGAIVIGPVQLNFTLIPIVLGAILFGAWGGLFHLHHSAPEEQSGGRADSVR